MKLISRRTGSGLALTLALVASAGAGPALAAPPAAAPAVGPVMARSFTAAQVAQHNTAKSCWVIVGKKVYNLTRYAKKHPGGKARIRALCGTDATAAFTGKHGLKGKPARVLKRYKIGRLKVVAPVAAPTGSSYTLAQVATHNTLADCWTVVGTSVYNLTSFAASHPGGQAAIASLCGKDGTAAFTAQHGSTAAAKTALAALRIGDLAGTATTTPTPTPGTTSPPTPAPTGTGYTLAQVATHNTLADCWTVVGTSVYNLTSFAASHPGGQAAIASLCGKDGTAAFTAQHGSTAAAKTALASLRIGDLAGTASSATTAPPTTGPGSGGGDDDDDDD